MFDLRIELEDPIIEGLETNINLQELDLPNNRITKIENLESNINL